jgi:hypothetical protein
MELEIIMLSKISQTEKCHISSHMWNLHVKKKDMKVALGRAQGPARKGIREDNGGVEYDQSTLCACMKESK